MLQGVPSITGNSGDGGGPSTQPLPPETAGAEPGFEDGDRSSAGNRWPRQETLALLKIRSDMDVAFRDSSLKGPLWDEVSRKLAELGYHRSSKKCKEKFENVYKYHKRTKEGRTSKSDGKTYRFFDQLQALEAITSGSGSHHPPPPAATHQPPVTAVAITPAMPSVVVPFTITESHQNNVNPISVAAPAAAGVNHVGGFPFENASASTNSSSSSTSSDEEPPEMRRKRKRKWKDLFGKLMKEVVDKQEEMQKKFLDALDRREKERAAREESWRVQEMAKMNREHDLLAQERSIAAAKDAAVITFLQKITEQNPNVGTHMPQIQQQQQQQQQQPPPPPPPQQQYLTSPPPPPQPQQQPPPPPQQPKLTPPPPLSQPPAQQPPPQQPPPLVPVAVATAVQAPAAAVVRNIDNNDENMLAPSPSRWPKAEINALIKLRTTLDIKYQENGPKGPLWEEISSMMRKLGYNRNAKRCKEKWENINKYYKKVKESSKKRPEDSKTCPYFHQLDAIYRQRDNNNSNNNINNNNDNNNLGFVIKPETVTQMGPIMARPEQQWPLAAPAVLPDQQRSATNEAMAMVDHESENEYDDDDDEEEEEDESGEYEIVANKTSSMAAVEGEKDGKRGFFVH